MRCKLVEIRWHEKTSVFRFPALNFLSFLDLTPSFSPLYLLHPLPYRARRPIYSADFHSAPPTEHQKAHHPYAATGATGAAMSESERKEMESKERERTERDKKWRLATCGADNVIRVRSLFRAFTRVLRGGRRVGGVAPP